MLLDTARKRLRKEQNMSVFEFLAEDFVKLQQDMEEVCRQMENAECLDALMERYQQILDESMSMDADNYETNIRKELKVAGLQNLEELQLSAISGGEYKLLQVIKQILRRPSILVMDEPDVFLDFGFAAHAMHFRAGADGQSVCFMLWTHLKVFLEPLVRVWILSMVMLIDLQPLRPEMRWPEFSRLSLSQVSAFTERPIL